MKALENPLDAREKNLFSQKWQCLFKKNFVEFNGTVKEQIPCAAISNKCPPSYECIVMNEFETIFISTLHERYR